MVLQPSTIEEREFHLGFSQQYIRQLRNEATRFGNQLMRVLLVCRATGQEEITTEKIEVDRIIPQSVENNSFAPETFQNQLPKTGGLPSLFVGRQPQEHSLSTSETNSAVISITQEVNREAAESPGHDPVEHSFSDCVSNPAYSPIGQAAREDPATPVTEHQPDCHSSRTAGNNPAYPPIEQAVKEDSSTEDTGHLPQSSANANNPAYPPSHQAVKEDSFARDTGHLPQSGANANNPPYPPIHRAVRIDSRAPVTGAQGGQNNSRGGGNRPFYTPSFYETNSSAPSAGVTSQDPYKFLEDEECQF